MRIISKFREYYDGVQGMDLEKSDIWIRKRELVEDPWGELGIHNILSINKFAYESEYDAINGIFPRLQRGYFISNYYVDFILVGFCGKFYPMIVLEENSFISNYNSGTKKKPKIVLRTFDDYSIFRSKNNEVYQISKSQHVRTTKCISDFFNKSYDFLNPLFAKLHVPYFVLYLDNDGVKMEINPDLSMVHMKRLFDAYVAYQEISMYMFGVLGNNEDIKPMDNECVKNAHGFGHKYAFKKMPKNKR